MATPTNSLPSSIETEKLILGAALLDHANFGIVGTLIAEDFALEKHRRIFAAMSEIHGRGETIDRVTVANEIVARGQLESIDGFTYLSSLDDGLPQVYNLDSYVRIVREKATLRRAVIATQLLMDELSRPDAGPEAIERATATLSAIAVPRADSWVSVSQVIARAGGIDKFLSPPTGISWPWWPKLADLVPCLEKGELWVVAARTGRGKSAFGGLLARGMARMGLGVAIYSLEMTADPIIKRMLAAESGVSYSRIRMGDYEEHHRRRVVSAAYDIDQLPLWFADQPTPKVSDIRREVLKNAAAGRKAELLVVDYLQLMSGAARSERTYERVSAVSRGLKLLASEFQIPVVALSQLSRAIKGASETEPQLSDLKDSGSIENDANGVVFLHTTEKERAEARAEQRAMHMQAIVAKQRNGSEGRVSMTFNGYFMTINEESA